jgi:hypothetical protein
MPNPKFAFALFLSSYAPAFLIIAVRSFQHSCLLFWASLVLAMLSASAFLIFIKVARSGGAFVGTVSAVEPRDGDLAAYVATYLLPFVMVSSPTTQDVIALAIFLFFIGLLWVNSRMLYLNPLLALVRYRLFIVKVRVRGGNELPRAFLLSRQNNLEIGDEVNVDRLATGVLIDLTPRDAPVRTQ